MKVINRKQVFQPYKKINDKHVIIMFDYKPITKMINGEEIETPLASWEEVRFTHIPTIDEIKNIVIAYYNEQIHNNILSGFQWKNMQIWLSNENQFNYKAAYDMAIQTKGDSLPIFFKFGDENNVTYYEFKTIEDLTDFYTKMITFIQETLYDGWQKKDNINWMIFQ